MRVLITNKSGNNFITTDVTRYVADGSLSIEDSINVPTLTNFILTPTDNSFVIPPRSSYVTVVSDQYASGGGGYGTGKILSTGFITNYPAAEYLGLSPKMVSYGEQQLSYKVNVTSDEWLLNSQAVPYIPAFVNRTEGDILASIANTLMPGFFDVTSFVGSGDIVPYYQYSPDQTWSDVAKTFGDSSRYRYKVINKVVYFVPFGDNPLGVSYDERLPKPDWFPLELQSSTVTVPPVNDCLVIGQTEPQVNWENYFIGDGFSSQFRLVHKVFDGATVLVLQDDWTEDSFQTQLWTVRDQFNLFSLDNNGQPIGALNVITPTGMMLPLGTDYIRCQNGVELGGGLNLQHGQVEFINRCGGGIVGGLYSDVSLTMASCLAGFGISSSGTVVVTASGAGGVVMQPIMNGALVGPQVVSQPNHQYVLQTWVGVERWDRYERIYRNIANTATFGGNNLAAKGTISWVIQDYDQGLYAITPAYLQQTIKPQVTKYTLQALTLPEFAVYAPMNVQNLNLTLNYTAIYEPPQGTLFVRALTGASEMFLNYPSTIFNPNVNPSIAPSGQAFGGGTVQFALPVLPQNLGPEIHYLMGFGMSQQTGTVLANGDTNYLAFYNDSIPGVGSRIRYQSWAAGESMSRVVDSAAVVNEAQVSGDSGVRSAIMTNLTPAPRTSGECELAAAAAIRDREFPQFQGTYTVETVPRKFETLFNPGIYDYPVPGRYFNCYSPFRGIVSNDVLASGTQPLMVNTTRLQVTELREEVLQLSVDYGPDLYLERLLQTFNQRTDKILTPQETAIPPNPIDIALVGDFFLNTPDAAEILTIQNSSVTGNTVVMDVSNFLAQGVTGVEIRRVDSGWGNKDKNQLVGVFTTEFIVLPRTSRDQTWYLRYKNGAQYSRFSKALRVVYPLIPSPPLLLAADSTQATFDFNGDIRDVYGLEIRIPPGLSGQFIEFVQTAPEDEFTLLNRSAILVPTDQAAGGKPVIESNNVQAYFSPPSNTTFPAAEFLQVGDIVFVDCPNNGSYTGEHVVSTLLTASGGAGPLETGDRIGLYQGEALFYPNNTNWYGGTYYGTPGITLPPRSAAAAISSLEFNTQSKDPPVQPLTADNYDGNGNFLGRFTPWSGATNNYMMAVTGNFSVPASRLVWPLALLHDDGLLMGVGGGATISIPGSPRNFQGPGVFPGQTTPVLGLTIQAGVNESTDKNGNAAWEEYGSITFPSAGLYPFEMDFVQWKDNQTLVARTSNLAIPYNQGGKIYTATFTAPVSGSPWGIGWFDYGEPFPNQIGSINYGVASTAATCQLISRNGYVLTTSGAIQAGTGVCTINTDSPHGFSVGSEIVMGSSWKTFPQSGYPPLANTGNVFSGLKTVIGVPTSTSFQFVAPEIVSPITPWEVSAKTQGVPTQQLNGVVSMIPPAQFVNLSALSGVLVQKPVFAPADLHIDFTQPEIKEILGILEDLNPNSLVQGLDAYFFNLTWDYSQPTPIPSFAVPVITGLIIDDNTQQMIWNLASSGTPTGYRITMSDPYSGLLYNKYTIDHPQNLTTILQSQLTAFDYVGNRLITIIPFNAVGDGPPLSTIHAGTAVTTVSGGLGAYIIHVMVNGSITGDMGSGGQIIGRTVYEQAVVYSQDLFPSQAWIDVPPTSGSGDMIFSVQRFSYADGSEDTGVEVACVTFTHGTHIGTITSVAGGATFGIGDVVKIIASSQMGNGVGIAITLSGVGSISAGIFSP